ncbi:hypothetical protein OH77DRAFT_1507538 [Trametes cingulata]|nr:hypothetical protein OH77DRAFT_1507538 [Trametes cingulata]
MTAAHDSRYAIDGLTLHLPKWEGRGWLGVANAALFKEAAADLRARSAPTTFRWGNEEADKLARQGAMMERTYLPYRLPHPTRFLMEGAELACISQSMAYRLIQSRTSTPQRKTTKENVRSALEVATAGSGKSYAEKALWTGLRQDPIRPVVRDFLWKATHGAYKVGAFWKNVPGLEARATCTGCGAEESLEHILVHCDATGRAEVWEAARELLGRRGLELPGVSLGMALGGPLLSTTREDGSTDRSGSRLLRLVVSESAYCVWVLRCERVIAWCEQPGREHTVTEVRGRWMAAINKRLQLDVAATSRACGKRALPRKTVLRTWTGLLKDGEALPEDWIDVPGVLVGRLDAPHLDAG